MQAIETKYIPAGNVRGSRIKASCERGSLTIGYPHEYNAENGHRYAAKCLIAKFCAEDLKPDYKGRFTAIEKNPWNRPFVTGGTKKAYVHVFIDSPLRTNAEREALRSLFGKPLARDGQPDMSRETAAA